MKLWLYRDVTLAQERILYLQILGIKRYGWLEGSPAVGYRLHFSRYLCKDWWTVIGAGRYIRLIPDNWRACAMPRISPDDAAMNARIRDWASSRRLPCADRGPIPPLIRAAFLLAHGYDGKHAKAENK